jgi:tetratricopeptide (TPR) repeat protein
MPGETLRQIAAARLGDAHWFYALARYNNIAVPRDLDATRSLKVPPRGGAPRLRPAPARAAASPGPAVAPVVAPVASPAPVTVVAAPAAPAPAPLAGHATPAVPAAPAPGLPNLNNLPPTSAGPAGGAGEGRSSPAGTDADQAFRRASAAEKAGKIDQAYALYMRALTLGHTGAAERAGVMRQELIARYRRDARVAVERQDPERAIKAWRFVLELDPDDAMATAELRKLQRRKDAPKAP